MKRNPCVFASFRRKFEWARKVPLTCPQETELVGVSVMAGGAPSFGLIEMEVLGELLLGGLVGEATVALTLLMAKSRH